MSLARHPSAHMCLSLESNLRRIVNGSQLPENCAKAALVTYAW
jgi:hypothetical protein